jgi:hypothetical protein
MPLQISPKFGGVCTMRASPFLCGFFLLISLGSLSAEQLPEMRPAFLVTGPRSLVNLIDTESLMKRGQGDAVVMFSCDVADNGSCYLVVTYRGTPNSGPLTEEIVAKCPRSKFIPAVYQHKNVNAVVSGAVIYRVLQGKPHLRIYLNQETERLLHGEDFISPQGIYFYGQKIKGIEYPKGSDNISATVVFTINVDATGKVKGSKLVFESPLGRGFGNEVMSKINNFVWLPGYLHGKAVACSATLQFVFRGAGRGTGEYWKTDQ